MTDMLSVDELENLMRVEKGVCISIYMPTLRGGAEIQHNQILYKNMLKKAEEDLISSGLRQSEIKNILSPAQELLKNVSFWLDKSDGLAMFIAPGFLKYYQFAQGLGELVVVTDRFHVKPLIPIMGDKTEFYVLAISQKNVRFLECTRCGAKEISIEGIPDNIVDALGLDDFETHLHLHTGAEDIKSNIFQYFQQVDRGLREFLKNRRIPLIFAGVDYLYPIYREANTYSCLTDKNVSGNPEGLSTEKLHEMAWPIAESFFEKKKNEAIEQYRQNAGTGLASADITEIVKAAHHGRVGVLFVPIGIQQWGVFDRDVDTVKLHENPESGDEDLLDFAAIQTLLNRGTVYAMNIKEIPDEVAPAAIFRY